MTTSRRTRIAIAAVAAAGLIASAAAVVGEQSSRSAGITAAPSRATGTGAQSYAAGMMGWGWSYPAGMMAAVHTSGSGTSPGARASRGVMTGRANLTPDPSGLAGTKVHVGLMDMGMMGSVGMMGRASIGRWGAMRIVTDRTWVPQGTTALIATNVGTTTHELVVLPLVRGESVGMRPIGADNRVREAGSVGEASRSGGAGAGEGIAPHSMGWVTVRLQRGRYELVCNIPGHYRAGMYAELDVR